MADSSRRRGILTVGVRLPILGPGRTRLGSGEEHRFNQIEVPFLAHALYEDGADHAAPAMMLHASVDCSL